MPAARPAIALVSREVAPFGGGGIAEYVESVTPLLQQLGDVTVFTTSLHREAHDALLAHGWRPPAPMVLVEEPSVEDARAWNSPLHLYSSRVWDALREFYGDSPPALVEFSDYLGEGFVTTQANHAGDPWLDGTTVAIRLHSSAELCSVLDGHVGRGFTTSVTLETERFALYHADVLIPPGHGTWETYTAYYGEGLAPPVTIRYPLLGGEDVSPTTVDRGDDERLRLLYMGRLERRKGVHHLVRALQSVDRDDWTLTLVGGDTDTGPLGTSMRENLEEAILGDDRIHFSGHVPPGELGALVEAHDIVVLPSLWENWPYVALRALAHNRPIAATPTGGFVEIVQEGASGWLSGGTGMVDLWRLFERVLGKRDELKKLTAAAAPQKALAELADTGAMLEAYTDLVERGGRRPGRGPRAHSPLVSAIVPYFELDAFVEETVISLFEQTYANIEVIVVNDGSFREEDRVLARLATRYPLFVLSQANSGLGAARNAGIRQSRGKYVFPLDADNLAEPTFVERCVEALERRPDRAYATSWSRYVDSAGVPLGAANPGYQPLGNWSRLVAENNIAGDAAAVVRRWLFDIGYEYDEELTSYEDWAFYRRLHDDDRFGVVIPDRLIRYRVRDDSMIRATGLPYLARLEGELNARAIERSLTWTSMSA